MDWSLEVQRSELEYDVDKDYLGGGACGEVFKAILRKAGKPGKRVAVRVFDDYKRRKKDRYFRGYSFSYY